MFNTPTRQTRSSSRLSTGRAGSVNPQQGLTSPQQNRQPASFFVRERSTGTMPQQNNLSFGSTVASGSSNSRAAASTNQLLRGAQKPGYDPYSPSHSRTSVGMHSILSSEPDDSRSLAYDYQAEERLAAQLEAQESHRINNVNTTSTQESSRHANGSNGIYSNGHLHAQGALKEEDDDDNDDLTSDGDAAWQHHQRQPRRPRTSKDHLPYRPDSNDEAEDRDSDVSAGGKKHSHRRRSARHDWPKMREGRDDNKIWCGQKKKRRSPRKKDEHGNDVGDNSYSYADTTLEGDDDAQLSHHDAAAATKGDGGEAATAALLPSATLQSIGHSIASFLFSAPLMAARLGWHRLQSLGTAKALTWLVAPILIVTLLHAALFPSPLGTSTPLVGGIDDYAPRSTSSGGGLGSLLGGLFSRSRWGSRVLSPPSELPRSLLELSDRLAHLEDALSWEGFLRTNQAGIAELVSQQVDQRFSKALHKRLERLKEQLSGRFNDNLEAIQADILAKVHKQNQMYEEAGSWRPKGSKLPGGAPGSTADSGDSGRIALAPGARSSKLSSDGDLKLKDGTDLRETMLTLIDAALERYSADRIGMRDYALYTAGGRIVPEYTSETYSSVPKMSPWSRLFGGGSSSRKRSSPGSSASAGLSSSSSGVAKAIRGRPPLAALHPDTSPGMCWSFAGSTGNLGVYLSRPTQVTAISIEHTPRILTLDEGSSAPREVAVWGIVTDAQELEKLAAHRASMATRAYASWTDSGYEDDDGLIDAAPAPPSNSHLLLTTAMYELLADRKAIQTFEVPQHVLDLGITVESVQFQFLSNHGNEAYTCVYRVRVHGGDSNDE